MERGAQLLRWYDKHGRRLPWRLTRQPYRILVSEVMLQQTQVERVMGYYQQWLKLFPSWKALADASRSDVLRAWAGLGYNRRALVLRDIATQIVREGEPTTREGWLALKGVGPYTSAAMMAFAYKQAILPIDTNIRRVAGRLLLGIPYPQPEDDERIRGKAHLLLGTTRAHDVPQALFDLAATHCAKEPACAACPMQNTCQSAKKFLSGRIAVPKRMVRKARETVQVGKAHPDRIYRGRILALVRASTRPLRIGSVGPSIDEGYKDEHDRVWLEAMIDRLVKDQMVTRTQKTISHI